MQIARGFLPVAAVDQIVPVRNLIVDRATGRRAGDATGAMTIGHATIHAARGLIAELFFRKRQHEFVPMLHALRDGLVVSILTLDFKKPGDLAHTIPRPASWWPSPLPFRLARGGIRPASLCGIAGDSYPNWQGFQRRASSRCSARDWRSTVSGVRRPLSSGLT